MKLVTCGIFERELKKVMEDFPQLFSQLEPVFLSPALHVDLEALETKVRNNINKEDPGALLYGCNCHPDLKNICQENRYSLPDGKDCGEILAGKDFLREINQGGRDFYLTPGWLEHRDEIFKHGLGWDSIDARQNLGLYSRIVLLDTGVRPIDEMEILEFFDYCQVPIEVFPISLDHFKHSLENLLKS